jgi:hypothetical protein
MIVSYPDVIGALFTRLKASSQLMTEVTDRVGDEVKDAWGFKQRVAKKAIVVDGPKGGPGPIDPPLMAWRVDLTTYGGDKRSANETMRMVLGYLVPQNMVGEGFQGTGVYITSIEPETGPISLVDPNTEWAYSVCPLIVRFIPQ